MINLGYEVIDLHTRLAEEAGIGMVLYLPDRQAGMANTNPPLDNVGAIKASLRQKRYVKAIPVSAITIGREGKQLVDVEKIKPYVAGFSDDGNCLNNMDLLSEILKKNVLVMVHLEPETEMVEKYLRVLSTLQLRSGQEVGGRLHLQHISKASTINIIRKYKKRGLKFTVETCPHYFTYTYEVDERPVNPPLGTIKDVKAIKEALKNGTIDVIASDYAPIPRPRGTGFASFSSFIPLCYGLVLEKVLTPKQLKEKIHDNPLKIIQGA